MKEDSVAGHSGNLKDAMAHVGRSIETTLEALLPKPVGPEAQLLDAMRYATLGGGKRFRPFLVVATSELFSVAPNHSLRAAAAIEMIHCYSLVHDDMPCMDDDELRRGQPTVHVKYDEATAVLAGDGLQALAFEVLAHPDTHPDPKVRADLVAGLAIASGPHGMVGGQAIDLAAEHQTFDLGGITRLQQLKTGALIAFSCEAGAILGHADPRERHALKAYAHDLGLAFQIADDLLDVEGTVEEVGKKVSKDGDAGKATFVRLLGVEKARAQAQMLADQAAQHVAIFGSKAKLLQDVAYFVITRRS